MLGFIPGFTYLGGMDESLATPRLKTPRLQIQPGSVGIAGTQTGIYPSLSPGGWQIIGRTPLKLYDADKNPPVFIQAGDYIRYRSVTPEEYAAIAESVEKGTYQVSMQTINIPRRERRGTVLNVSHCVFYKVVAVGFNTLRYDASVGVLNPPHE